jgi:toxin-antitoxin system PIN domain toxin
MTCAIDANLLLYALNQSAPEHARANRFLDQLLDREEPLCLTWSVVLAFLRLATNPRILPRPLSPAAAREWLDEIINLPQTRLLSEEPGFWNAFCEVARPLNPRGADVTDVHLASILRQHGVVTLYSSDRGFRRFEFLKVVDPLA